MELGTLKIVYHTGEGVDVALDRALEEAAKKHGYTRWASGCNHITGERDLVFERSPEEEGDLTATRILLPPHNHDKWLQEQGSKRVKSAVQTRLSTV